MMSKPFRLGSAVSFVALASVLAACAAPQGRVAASSFGGKADGEVGLATKALAALNSNNVPAAIDFAERAVAKNSDDAGFRALLGNAYFAGGRFWSAESAYKDSLSIYSNQPQVVLKLALVEIALGKTDEAVKFLEAARPLLDPADYGLALALAGRPADAIAVLDPVARSRGSDSRVRQNLALAYAFTGDWTQARTVAAQDVPANQLDARVHQWMQLAKPAKPSDQVAALVGVTPAAVDQGQPVRLALRKPDARLAVAAPTPTPAPATAAASVTVPLPPSRPAVAQSAPVPGPAPQPQFVEAVVAPAPAPEPVVAVAPAPPPANPDRKPAIAEAASPAPVTMAMIAAAAPEAPSAFAAFMPKKPAAKPAKVRKAAAPAPRPAFRNSGPVVQLGAYRTPQYVNAAWGNLTKRYPALRAYLPMRARFVSPKGTYWRLSISGFASQREAIARCQLLKSRGGNCFVRNFAGDAPVQYASR